MTGSESDGRSARGITRRLLLGIGVTAGVAAVTIPWWLRRHGLPGSVTPPNIGSADEARVLSVVAAFAGACFGHQLSAEEVVEVTTSLRAIGTIDPPLAARFHVAADFADLAARRRGLPSFSDAPLAVRNAIVGDLMSTPATGRRSDLLSRFSRYEHQRRIVRWEVMTRLPRIYAGSAPAWRRRGYSRWPGMAGDPREYVTQGPAAQC